jgi:hypothetical protein
MRTLLLSSLLLLPHLTASALTISIDAEVLRDQFGNAMSQSGVVVLTAGTNGNFSGPSGSQFVTGDEMFLFSWDLSTWGTDGVFSGITADLTFTGDWGEGDPLRMYWYPDLTLAAAGPSAGLSYGTYSDATGLDGSAPWITPAENEYLSLGFFTSDASFLSAGGSNDPAAGRADSLVPPVGTVVPDTGGSLLLFSAGFAGLVTLRRLQKSRR